MAYSDNNVNLINDHIIRLQTEVALIRVCLLLLYGHVVLADDGRWSAVDGDGGWPAVDGVVGDSERCNIETYDAQDLSREQFLHR
jgi:hypothetical protein